MNANRINRFLIIGISITASLCIIPIGVFLILLAFQNNSSSAAAPVLPQWAFALLSGLVMFGVVGTPILLILFGGFWFGSYIAKKNEMPSPLQRTIKDEPILTTDKRLDSLVNIPNVSFHFANRNEIEGLYNDYFKEPTIEQIVSEIAGEVSGETNAKIPKVLETKIGGKDFSKWISTIKIPDISTEEKFRRYQRQIILNGQVNLGLELVDIDLSELNKFESLLLEIKSQFGVNFDNVGEINALREVLKQKAAEKTIIRLENATGQVLVDGKFTISELDSKSYKCTYEHPVSQYLIGQKNKIKIGIILQKESIESSIAGNYAQAIGKSIPLKVYGKVWQPADRNSNVWELLITPIAVYQ